MSLNKAMVIGNLGDDPEVRFTGSGQAVATLNIATNESWMDKQGQKQDRTEWHRVVVWGKQAEHCKEFLSKGRQVFVEGRIQTRDWQDKEGQKRYTTEIVAQRVQFLGGRGGGGGQGQGGGSSSYGGGGSSYGGGNQGGGASQQQAPAQDFGDDDIPF